MTKRHKRRYNDIEHHDEEFVEKHAEQKIEEQVSEQVEKSMKGQIKNHVKEFLDQQVEEEVVEPVGETVEKEVEEPVKMNEQFEQPIEKLMGNVNVIHTRCVIDIKSTHAKKLQCFIYKKKEKNLNDKNFFPVNYFLKHRLFI